MRVVGDDTLKPDSVQPLSFERLNLIPHLLHFLRRQRNEVCYTIGNYVAKSR